MDNLQDQIIALADELRGGDAEDNDLGFVETGSETEFVFLNRQEFDHGHMIDGDGNPVPLPGEAMAGYIDDVFYHFNEHETYGLSQKLRIVLDTQPGRIMLETGFFTNTSKSLLSGLALVENPNSVITIEPSLPDDPGDSPNVLFTELYEDGELIQSNGNWPHEDEDVIDLFHEVREDIFGLEPQDVEPKLPDRSNSGGGNSRDGGNGRSRSGNGNGRNRSGGGRDRSANGNSNGARSSNRRQSNRGQNNTPEEALA